MKSLFLTTGQAISLAENILDYASMQDNNKYNIVREFEIVFGDLLAIEPHADQSFELVPIVRNVEIG